MDRKIVFRLIDLERDYQDEKWGTIKQHPHEVGAWLTVMRQLMIRAEEAWMGIAGDKGALDELRKVVSVGVACLEQHGCPARVIEAPIPPDPESSTNVIQEVVLQAVEHPACVGCVFFVKQGCLIPYSDLTCLPRRRNDGKNIVWRIKEIESS